MTFANPWGLLLGALAIPVIVMHILRPRRQAVTVSSTYLWESVQRPVSAAQPWQKLRWSWLLVAQLLAIALLAVAVARPARLTPARLAAHTVFIIDASGSMAAVDGNPDRLASAKAEAERLRTQIPDGGVVSVVVAADKPRVVLTASNDAQAFTDSLRTVQLTEGRADFTGAFALAESLETSAADIGFVLLSDGGLTQEEQKAQPPGTVYRTIGTSDTNRAITRLVVEPRGTTLHVRATLKNTGGPVARQPIRIDVDGVTAATSTIELKPGAAVEFEADVPVGDRVEAYLEGTDLLAADNHAVAVAGRRPPLKVLLVGDPAFIGELLSAIPNATVTLSTEASPTGEGFDVVVYNGTAVPDKPEAPFLAIAPPGGVPGVSVTGSVDQPAITLLRSDDPLVAGIDLSDVGIASAQRVTAPGADVLAGAEGAPLMLHGVANDRPYVYLAFALGDSNLPVKVAFPLLGDRVLTELSGTALPTTSLEVGAALPVSTTDATTIVSPSGRSRTVDAGGPTARADVAGFWTVRSATTPERLIAVNPPPTESLLAPADRLVKPADPRTTGNRSSRGQRSLFHWILLALLAVLVSEFLLARRGVGVSKRQWRLAVGLRALIAAALIAALFTPIIRRPATRTATVFLLDDSASLGPGGRAAALDWIRQAMGSRGRDDLAAIVSFGAEARLDRLLEATSDVAAPQVVIDPGATSIEAALRLGDAVLPDDARRRIVLVSDGRQTSGDAADEAARLVERGTPVDVHTVTVAGGDDAAVSKIDVPRLTRVGEQITVKATVEATKSGPAQVELRRNAEKVAEQVVDLVAGSNEVSFTDVPSAEAGAVVRYQIGVRQGGDTRPENDLAYAAVPVDGPAKVLLVEGSSGEAASLDAALHAGGIATTVIAATEFPDAQELISYSGVVMVDVDVREFSGAQFQSLETAVRDLGRGLVTVGGPRSYGLGGYRGAPIEDLLPVVSDVLDPKRRKIVAEVLSIDTSGSMGNCHCDEGGNPANRTNGGVNKTDISRAAGARAVEALSDSDQIGILAWNSSSKWVVDLQTLPSADVVDKGLRSLKPDGNTNLLDSLTESAKALRESKAGLKHIILFTDGFTSPQIIANVADQAGELYAQDGITVSVVATGEGSAPSLREIAVKGSGRFYPGRDLVQVPQIIAEEAVIASRDFINEGDFLPTITAVTPVTEPVTSAPALLGYVATTAKGTATTAMRIGPDADPLLATWQAGLGTVTSWTSDASAWAAKWSTWDGYVDFWARLVKQTFPSGDTAGAAQASLSDGKLTVTVTGDGSFPDGSTAVANVAGPDGQRIQVPLERAGGDSFSAEVPAPRTGSYAVGVQVTDGSSTVLAASTLASESYPAEYVPGVADQALMTRFSTLTNGRGEIEANQTFVGAGLKPGVLRWDLRGPLLLLATLLWPLAVALSRLSLRGADLATSAGAGARRAARRLRDLVPRLAPPDPDNRPAAGPTSAPLSDVNEPRRARLRRARRHEDGSGHDGGQLVGPRRPSSTSPPDMSGPATTTRQPQSTAAGGPSSPASSSSVADLVARKRASKDPPAGAS